MKKALYGIMAVGAALLAVACEQDVYEPVDFKVGLDASNTYVAGEPVKFNFAGNADYVIAYTGDTGSQYKYKDRTEVDMADLETCKLVLNIQARYGNAGALKYYVAKGYTGLLGNNAATDYAALKAESDKNYSDWDALTYTEGASTVWTTQEYDITQYANNFTLAMHWNPTAFNAVQRSYWVNATLKVKFKGYDEVTVSGTDLGFGAISMADANASNRYNINNGNGSVIFNKPTTAQIIMQGVGANALSYNLDYWVVSKPRKLNSVSPDTSVNVKAMADDVSSYQYTYEKAGTYTATFIATTGNYKDSSRVVKEVTFTVVDKID